MLSRVLQTCLLAPSKLPFASLLPGELVRTGEGWASSTALRFTTHCRSMNEGEVGPGNSRSISDLHTVHLPLIVFVLGRNLNRHVTAAVLLLIQITNDSVSYGQWMGSCSCAKVCISSDKACCQHLTAHAVHTYRWFQTCCCFITHFFNYTV